MISLGRLISPSPIPVTDNISFYQSTIDEILQMGENMYWSLLKVWDLQREDLLSEESDYSKTFDFFTL